jgi:hypothetical protein
MQNKVLIAAAVTGIVIAVWYLLRQANTANIYEQMGITPEDLGQYAGSDAWVDPENWKGYEFGDPVPEAAKR